MPYKDPDVAREKHRAYSLAAYARNKDRRIAQMRAWISRNPDRRREIQIRSMEKNYARMLWSGARKRSARAGIEFSISVDDILLPEFCPVLGIRLDYSVGGKGGKQVRGSPSLDRIDSAKGYVHGNVVVMSMRANRIKSDATPDELKRVAAFVWALS